MDVLHLHGSHAHAMISRPQNTPRHRHPMHAVMVRELRRDPALLRLSTPRLASDTSRVFRCSYTAAWTAVEAARRAPPSSSPCPPHAPCL